MIEDLRLWQTRLDFTFEVIDIDDDQALQRQFGLMVPVLMHAHQIICYGRLNVAALEQLLQT